ncbi:vacuolar ATP synthase subunit, putative [Ichthyophthirius multifiliis]|uniref:V-type proton ATPase subunit C n=1 Tax=Ichthyophthirius multifiliis TaxID=5932 RepID=G0R5B2_ICHMU|nr:vacuolar ATP synthase subunit, putative [Ichthyophthirius multifiliis]EGR27357.1 vacuolar ATP synthase subunit, putative [Ichthyophthirius multifiliis]|eukprot:XP_004024241.1 vacuolar ATP synthase subunit, putative [Ichthyophthirius multifiliis]
MVYFLIGSTLIQGNQAQTWENIRKEVSSLSQNLKQIDVESSKFKLGNLDSLMHANETMLKLEQQIEGLLKKIERQYLDLTEQQTADFKVETKNDVYTLPNFVQTFKWDDATFSRSNPLPELLKILKTRMSTIENDIRQKTTAFQDAKNQSNVIAMKEGNLLVKDLGDVLDSGKVKPKDFIYNDSVTTVCVIVQKQQIEKFQNAYETIHHCVVPGSAKQFDIEDRDGYTLWRVLVMKYDYKTIQKQLLNQSNQDKENNKRQKTPVEEFMAAMRDQLKLTVREFEYKPTEYKEREKQRTELQVKTKSLSSVLKQTCEKSFGGLYNTYIHLKYLRLVVDIATRFGIKNKFSTCLIEPSNGKEKQIQVRLMKLFGDPQELGMYGTKEELEDTEDFFPYIFVPINI